MNQISDTFERRTVADGVFEAIYDEIVSLKLLPGTKLSEADIARRFGVSRQPVRDAFSRLANLDLLLIRPQKATEVRGFSMERIAHARFVRLSVELEVIRRACAVWDSARADALAVIVDAQRAAIDAKNTAEFHARDFEFHKTICELGGFPLAAETIAQAKHKIDRICVLSLGRAHEVETLWDDHKRLAQALSERDAEKATAIARQHLARLDDTITEVHAQNAGYFE